MKHVIFSIFISCSFIIYPQDTTQKVIRIGGGPMSDFQNIASLNADHIAQLVFKRLVRNMNLEVALWETLCDSDTLSKVVLFNENLIKNENEQIILLVDQNKAQVDIKCVAPGKVISISPLKPQKKQIQAYTFLSKPHVRNTHVPILLFEDEEENATEKNLTKMLTIDNIKSIDHQQIEKLKKDLGNFKILTYHLKYIP